MSYRMRRSLTAFEKEEKVVTGGSGKIKEISLGEDFGDLVGRVNGVNIDGLCWINATEVEV